MLKRSVHDRVSWRARQDGASIPDPGLSSIPPTTHVLSVLYHAPTAPLMVYENRFAETKGGRSAGRRARALLHQLIFHRQSLPPPSTKEHRPSRDLAKE